MGLFGFGRKSDDVPLARSPAADAFIAESVAVAVADHPEHDRLAQHGGQRSAEAARMREHQLPPFTKVLTTSVKDMVALVDARQEKLLHVCHSEAYRNSVYLNAFIKSLSKQGFRIDETVRTLPVAMLRKLSVEEDESTAPAGPHDDPRSRSVRASVPELRILSEILNQAIEWRASDVRFSVQQGGGLDKTIVRMRIDGVYREVNAGLNAATGLRMIAAAYATNAAAGSGNVEVFSGDVRQEAFLTFPNVRNLRARYNLIPMCDGSGGARGPDVVIRLLSWDDRAMRFRSPVEAGFSLDQSEALAGAAESPRGLMLVVGPTGSGKTTLAATLLSQHPELAAGTINAYAIEDPPELSVPNLRSISIKRSDKQQSEDPFVVAMRDLLRQDPDIVVPGEIRDGVSCGLVVQMTFSHKVMATFHASDFLSTMLRLRSKEIGYPAACLAATPFAGGLVAVASVGLLPKLCPLCAKPVEIGRHISRRDAAALHGSFRVDPTALKVQGDGCTSCGHRGVEGRTAIGEVVVPDDGMRALMREEDFNGAYQRYRSFSDGDLGSGSMRGKTIFEHALLKAIRGEVSIADVVLQVDSPAYQAANGGAAIKGM